MSAIRLLLSRFSLIKFLGSYDYCFQCQSGPTFGLGHLLQHYKKIHMISMQVERANGIALTCRNGVETNAFNTIPSVAKICRLLTIIEPANSVLPN